MTVTYGMSVKISPFGRFRADHGTATTRMVMLVPAVAGARLWCRILVPAYILPLRCPHNGVFTFPESVQPTLLFCTDYVPGRA